MSPSLATAPLGVRALAFVLRNLTMIAVCAVLGGASGAAIGVAWPRPYVDRAVLEVGLRFVSDPIEHPMTVAHRLVGELYVAANELGVEHPEIVVENRRDQKTNALTRLIDVSVTTDTPEHARAITQRGLKPFVDRHAEANQAELAILVRQLERLEAAAKHLQTHITTTDTEEAEELNALLYENHRMINGTRGMATDVRLPASRVVSHAVEPLPTPTRTPVFALGGLVFGLFLGVAVASWREIERGLG